MWKILVALIAGGLLVIAQTTGAEAAIYVYVDEAGTPHFTDAPTKSYFRPLPAFGLPRGVDITRGQYADLINEVARDEGVDPELVRAIVKAESNFEQNAVSRKGAQGLMQLMPGTAWRYAIRNAFDPKENIRGGVRYLRNLHDLFPGRLPLVLAAYNAGENAVLRYNGIPPYRETRTYVSRVLGYYGRANAAAVPGDARPPGQTTTNGAIQVVPSTPSVFRTVDAGGTPLYTNLPPLVQSPR
jgi:soluble lytic murein transglycosylase-like protein